MSDSFKFIGQMVRFPVYVLGVLAWVVLLLPLALVFKLLMILWMPIEFLKDAFKGEEDEFRRYKEEAFGFDAELGMLKNLKYWLEHG